MLKLPADMKITNTAEAVAMKLSAKKMEDDAAVNVDDNFSRQIAADLDEAADSYLILTETPVKGVGGEFVQQKEGNPLISCPSLKKADRINVDASLDRVELAHKNGVLNMALDTAEALGAKNGAEQMLAHQMAAVHRMSLDLMAEAGNTRDPVEKCRLLNTSARLMETYQKGLLTINRIRTGGQQTVTVQHVQVSDGGQAVINGSLDVCGRGGSKK
ncbi:MAG: hypothetical protein IPH06_06300 [Alphaproteobacteria bacterium]|nr:hypothetical protein [Alphaproteobacteria bacterium]QQS57629.1 MAG: hypothetical protein IPN28_02065 [Alphaproteobacteria bacterium]